MSPRIVSVLALTAALCMYVSPAHAQWVWSPESGWVNQRYAGSETPKELEKKAAAAEKAKKTKSAAKTRAKIADKFPLNLKQAKAALFKAAETAYGGGEYVQADDLYQKYTRRYGKDAREAKVLARRYDIGRAILLRTHSPKRMSTSKSLERGEKILTALIDDYPLKRQPNIGSEEVIDDAMMVLGSYYLREKRYDEAIATYKRLRKTFPTSEWANKALYQIGVANSEQSEGAGYDTTKVKKGRDAMAGAETRDPEGKVGKAAREAASKLDETLAEKDLRTARFYLGKGRTRAARVYLKRAIAKYPQTKAGAEAKKLLEEMGK